KQLFIGGDAVPDLLLQKLALIFRCAQITVTYGPTEGTIFCTQLSYAPGGTGLALRGAVIGSAISRMVILILDADGQLCPVGVSGELCITGAGVSQGYLNQPELTSEKFVSHPFEQSAMMYKTGDLGRRLSDGNIEFSGRKDDQVKIRGYRIEPGEIERVLEHHELISAAVVLAREGADGERVLVAYLVGESLLNVPDIRSYLSARLPSYMVPGHFLQLERLPLTSNGKVDRKSLPAVNTEDADVERAHIAPRNEIEEKLVLIWQEILGREKISVKAHFFELGGHSLKATRLSAKIHKTFDVRVAMKDVFIVPVLEDQAALIEKATGSSFLSIPPAASAESYVLSSSQRRLWVLSQFEDGNIAYNIPGVYVFEGALNIGALERSFLTLIERHEILR
ncbi:AMP-binding enzyme C-terminal domain-containing protein, partial [Pedobacter steynii]